MLENPLRLLARLPAPVLFGTLLVLLAFVPALCRPAASAIISDLLPSDQRATGFAALRMAVNLGFALGMAMGGLLADWNWRWLFFGDGLTTLLYGVVVYVYIPETRPEELEAPTADRRAVQDNPLKDSIYLQMVFVAFVFSLIFFSHISVMPLTVTVSAGYPALVYGLLVGTNGLLI